MMGNAETKIGIPIEIIVVGIIVVLYFLHYYRKPPRPNLPQAQRRPNLAQAPEAFPGPCGIVNGGMSCTLCIILGYLNSAMQCLLASELFKSDTKNIRSQDPIITTLQTSINSCGGNGYGSTRELQEYLGSVDPIFRVNKMSDSYYVVLKIFELLDKANIDVKPTKWFRSNLVNECTLY